MGMKFDLVLENPGLEISSDNSADEIAMFRDRLASYTPTDDTRGAVRLEYGSEGSMRTPEQLANFTAILNKGWNHIMTVSGTMATPPLNAWWSGMGSDISRFGSGCMRVTQHPDDEKFKAVVVNLFQGQVPRVAMASTSVRIANIAEWCTKYAIRLSSSTRLKWGTFNDISMFIRPAFQTAELVP